MNLNEIIERKDIDEHTFGKYLRYRREAFNKSVRTLAGELGITAAYLSDIENGNRSAPTNFLDKIISVLKIPEDEKQAFYDLASATRGFSYTDINPYLGQSKAARVALRTARDRNLTDEGWDEILELIKKRTTTET